MKIIPLLILTLCSFSGSGYSDITWSAPIAISTPLANASDPQTVIDANGNATAIWIEDNNIKASSLLYGGSWSIPFTLSNVLNTASSPKLGLDSSGNVLAMWLENTQIVSATLPFGGSWSAEPSPASGSGVSNFTFVVNANGNVVAVWLRNGFVESFNRFSGTWNSPRVLSAANSSYPDIAISNNDTAIAVWHVVVSGADNLITKTLNINTNSWSTPMGVFQGTAAYHHNYPKITMDQEGNAILAWFRYNVFAGNVYQNVQVPTTSRVKGAPAWAALPTFLSNQGLRNPADLLIQLKIDTNGDALAVWTNSYDGEIFAIESSQKIFGGSWTNSIPLQAPTIYSFAVDVALTEGISLMTTMAWDGVSDIEIQSQESSLVSPLYQIWRLINTFSTGSCNAYPRCALSLTGNTINAVTLWNYFDGLNTVIHASTGSDTTISPPSDLMVTQSVTDFGVYQDYYNTITWLPSSDPTIIQYNIYRNGVLITVIAPGTLEFIDHNQMQNGTVTYGIAAISSGFRLSPIITYTLNP